MSTNKTNNLGLHSWVRSDRFSMDEFNENFDKLDKTVGENSAAASTEAQARKAADDALTEALAKETQVRESNDSALSAAVAAETQTRASAISALTEAVAKCGNCKIETQTYKGAGKSGSSNKNSLTFSGKPLLVIVADSYYGYYLTMVQGNPIVLVGTNASGFSNTVSWSGNTVSWHTSGVDAQLNANRTYYVIAFLAADEEE